MKTFEIYFKDATTTTTINFRLLKWGGEELSNTLHNNGHDRFEIRQWLSFINYVFHES